MALALVGGAALGAAFQGLLTAVIKVSKRFAGFHSILKKLEATLERIKPYIQEMEKLNEELDRPRKEMEKLIQILQDGEKLIQDCSRCYCYQRIGYANKIKALDASLLRLFHVDVHAQVSRDVKEILAILKSNGCNWNYRGVSDEHENLGSCNAPGPLEFMVGLDVPFIFKLMNENDIRKAFLISQHLKELKRRLCEDGESRIVIRTPGGCGKTTLAKELCHDNQVREYFKHILYATVSRPPNLIAIITKLFWDEDERVPKFQNEEDAANQMELKLKKKEESGAVLLVLDDVWCGSESLLAKFKFRTSKSKVVVTSRNEFPEFGSTYDLELLNDDDAMALFRHSAIPQNGSCNYTPTDRLVKKIVGHCKGLPLALEIVGRSLHGRPVEIWRSRLKKLSEGQSIVNSETDLRKCLQSSLDALNDEDVMPKECFMDFTRNDASEIDGCYSDAFVMQHAFLHFPFAAELTNFSVLSSLSNLKRIRLEQVSIPTLCNTSMELKNLEKLSLVMCHKIGQAFASSTIQIPEMLPNLREINIDYCNDLVELPEGFCDLVQLNKLSISNCHKLSALPEGIGKLANLEVLRVSACTLVSKLPDSMGSHHKLSVLDITGCLRIRKMPKQIGELRGLRELHMRRCPGLRELPPSGTLLVDLEMVICDEETAQLWECYTHLLPNLTLSVPEEIINLNWL
ncbi:probable disease resistance protein At5g66900 [Vitis riparia]|uniref:probable disease resistance protein At5g66900 n=1 Tax=Vitis riparia TaxID=96939 RepID=UPI00155A3433|nr:probable disease resistance protein At5g66900 [Vitis riparia]